LTCRGTNDELHWQDEDLGGRVRAPHDGDAVSHAGVPHLIERRSDGGQGRLHDFVEHDVVETNNTDILRNSHPPLLEAADDADGKLIVVGHNSRRAER
jgi:hypothetical protein